MSEAVGATEASSPCAHPSEGSAAPPQPLLRRVAGHPNVLAARSSQSQDAGARDQM